ncbi:unnamed protein product [Linum tenue]|uniref:Major facilitator superfamily (MFS) profile domain-containing protein n=1 Tax=Linum tenue TaxID=586396 RepID=A0AAV0R392_9ROSI|nr:unnamed protein product [Linum tenue]
MAEMGMSVAQYSTFGSIMTLGGMLGSLFNGKMADIIGRRYTMWVSALFFLVSWSTIAFAKVFQFMITFGFSLAYAVGTIISWRALALLGDIPCLLHVVGIFFIPESPRWLAKLGKDKELEATLKYLRGNASADDVSQEALEIKEHTKLFESLSENRIQDLFQHKYADALIVVAGLMVLQEFGGTNAFSYYAASIFEMAGELKSFFCFGCLLSILGCELGMKQMLDLCRRSFGYFWDGINCHYSDICIRVVLEYLLAWTCILELGKSGTIVALLACIGMLGLPIAFSLGMAGLPGVVMAEVTLTLLVFVVASAAGQVFPINIKGTAGSLVTFLNWSSSWIVTYSFNFVMLWNSAGTFFIFTGIWILGILFIARFVPETKGRSLEELQTSITHIM